MTGQRAASLFVALRHPEALADWSEAQWERVIREARRSRLLGRLAALVERHGLRERVPPAPRSHLDAALALVTAQQEETRREIGHVTAALQPLGAPVILLKGAAYLMADMPAALGRSFMDLDILVPRARLAEVEASLMLHGWATTHHSAYDQRYYRQWMHELPPLRHHRRQTMLDVHHAILPLTARRSPDAGKLIDASQPIPGHHPLRTLAPEDVVLHSMAHLFHNDDLTHALRDLSDIDMLLRLWGTLPGFWPRLAERAGELGLERSLYYGLRYTAALLATPVPAEQTAAGDAGAPPWLGVRLMDRLWLRALRACRMPEPDAWTSAALFALYVRAHWMRMPPVLLARHLAFKAAVRWQSPAGA